MSEAPPFWLVWSADGYPPRYKHGAPQAAETEAERLARENPGKEFYVLAPVAKVIRRDVLIERYDAGSDGIPF